MNLHVVLIREKLATRLLGCKQALVGKFTKWTITVFVLPCFSSGNMGGGSEHIPLCLDDFLPGYLVSLKSCRSWASFIVLLAFLSPDFINNLSNAVSVQELG